MLVAMALAGWGYRHFREWHEHHPGRYTVARVIHEARNTWTLVLTPDDGRSIPAHLPGQFAFIELEDGPGAGEEHPFTISSSPEQKELGFTIRASGNFTNQIGEIAPAPALLNPNKGLSCGVDYSFTPRSRKEFPITETELKLIAAAAIMGLSNNPKNG